MWGSLAGCGRLAIGPLPPPFLAMYAIPVLAKELKLWAKRHPRKGADGPEVFDIGRAKRMIGFDGGSGNQGVGQLDAVGEGMLFYDRGCRGANGFGKRQDTKLERAE